MEKYKKPPQELSEFALGNKRKQVQPVNFSSAKISSIDFGKLHIFYLWLSWVMNSLVLSIIDRFWRNFILLKLLFFSLTKSAGEFVSLTNQWQITEFSSFLLLFHFAPSNKKFVNSFPKNLDLQSQGFFFEYHYFQFFFQDFTKIVWMKWITCGYLQQSYHC